MYWWQYILFPFALIFHLITWVRNTFYDTKVNQEMSFDANVVLVGNLSIGGTGKTPMIDYLIRYFRSADKEVGTLSRGYGRKTYGFRRANDQDNADTIGDEPFMYFEKYNHEVPVAVGGDRVLAIAEFMASAPNLDVILMDDGFQHRRVKPTLSMLLTTYSNPFFEDYILPAGRLRESRSGVRRADVIIVTKCPSDMSDAEMVGFRDRIAPYTEASVFFMHTIYEPMRPMFDNALPLYNEVIAISGMAYPQPFESYLRKKHSVTLIHNYRDHHKYTAQDVRDIIQELQPGISLVCTEKDKVKLQQFEDLRGLSCYYLPISMQFLRDEALFHKILQSKLNYNAKEGN